MNKLNEDRFEYQGKTFVSVRGDSCKGCYFIDKVCHETGSQITPSCIAVDRKDKYNVIYVEAKK